MRRIARLFFLRESWMRGWIAVTISGMVATTQAAVVRVCSHQGQEAESRALREIAAAFNDAHRSHGWSVAVTFFPDFQYTEKLAVAAAARDLPEAFDLDGPLVARFAQAGLLADIGDVYSRDELAD